jgi:hypothetical protein
MPARCKRKSGGAAFSSYQHLWISFVAFGKAESVTLAVFLLHLLQLPLKSGKTTRSTNQKRGKGIKKTDSVG